MIFSSPSKTFLCGEYAVLAGGSALVIAHEPRFQLEISHSTEPQERLPQWIHPESPAGRLYKKHEVLLKDFEFKFKDPHQGGGGFGASGAQFITLFAFLKDLKNELGQTFPGVLLKEFKALDSSDSSGCDVLAQWSGGVVRIHPAYPQDTVSLKWPFEDLDFLILPTGEKIQTHDHLRQLERKRLQGLVDRANRVLEAFEKKEEGNFLNNLKSFSSELEAQGLVAAHSLKLMDSLKSCPGLKLIKPCGAMGSDTLLLIIDKQMKSQARDFVRGALQSDISHGLKLESASW